MQADSYYNAYSAPSSLADSIGFLHDQFHALRRELEDVRGENSRLRQEVAVWRAQFRSLPVKEVAQLRRNVAYYCHPDRGGDADVMCKLNALFDFLTKTAA